ncbi:MAG TPA: hypothetical protein VFW62_05835, partial [bacterium]|nr:hypothetical protein [bacterium]
MKVTINQKAQERLIRGHDWIFRSDLVQVEAETAGPAEVVGEKGKLWGRALYSPKSLIALRMMTRGTEPIDGGLIKERIRQAIARREAWYPGEGVYRAVFGEADGLPSLVVDRFGETLVFQTLSAGMETFKASVVEALRELSPRALIERNDSIVRQREELPLIRQALDGEAPAEAEFTFAGKRFAFRPLEGQKTGFFLDQRFNAAAAARYAHGAMLDAFSYVGQFGIHAASRVESVLAVDVSGPALRQVEQNAKANGLGHVSILEANAFDFLKEADQAGR